MEKRLAQRDVSSLPTRVASMSSSLEIAPPDSPAEREADSMADSVPNHSAPENLQAQPDFSHVRVHTDSRAAEAARSIHADAFTVGQNIFFGSGRYATETSVGQQLLAHELTHTLQQRSGSRVHRKLSVEPDVPSNAPAGDPARSLTVATRRSMMDSLIQALCPEFKVDSAGDVAPNRSPASTRTQLAASGKPTGCCCLSILADASQQWTIAVSGMLGAQTTGHRIIANPTDTPIESGAFTDAGKLAFQGIVPTIGHELCGHAALIETNVHPPGADRTKTDVHDPTVRIENEISKEQGVAASDLRGLARSGPHRGESSDRIVIRNFPFNGMDVPASEKERLDIAAKYIFNTAGGQDEFVAIRGHSDKVGTSTAKKSGSEVRARNVKRALLARGVPETITKFGLTAVRRFNPVEGVSDTQPPSPPLDADDANWRRVEILVAGFPAGAEHIPPGTPTVVNAHTQSPNVSSQKASADPCISKLANEAYP
jgi:outer membrane protein OmpA-like peptidoglycan-associated protein